MEMSTLGEKGKIGRASVFIGFFKMYREGIGGPQVPEIGE